MAKFFSNLGSVLGIVLVLASGQSFDGLVFGGFIAALAAAAIGVFFAGAKALVFFFEAAEPEAREAIGLGFLLLNFNFVVAILMLFRWI